MARFCEPTKEQLAGWNKWVMDRPLHVRVIAERFEPWSLYRMQSTDHRVTLVSFDEEENKRVTLRVNVSAEFNFVSFERCVFGIDPDDLTPCELPTPDEVV